MQDALGYARVSSEEQADSGLGLEAQRQRIAAYCTMKGLRLAEFFENPGISGGKPLACRPAGCQLLAVAKELGTCCDSSRDDLMTPTGFEPVSRP